MGDETLAVLRRVMREHERADRRRFLALFVLLVLSTLVSTGLTVARVEVGNRRVVRNQARIVALTNEARVQAKLTAMLEEDSDLRRRQILLLLRQMNDIKAELDRRTPLFARIRADIRALRRSRR